MSALNDLNSKVMVSLGSLLMGKGPCCMVWMERTVPYLIADKQYYIIVLIKMRASYECIDVCDDYPPQIELIYSPMTPVYVEYRQTTKKYKKVGEEMRSKLLACIRKGCSIISVARRFNVNYSTTKSIVQNYRKRKAIYRRCPSDARISSTDECQSLPFSP